MFIIGGVWSKEPSPRSHSYRWWWCCKTSRGWRPSEACIRACIDYGRAWVGTHVGMRVVRPTDSPSVPLCSISECLHTRARLSVSLPLSSLVALSSRLSAFLSLHSLSVGWSVTFVCAWTRAVLLKAEGRKGKKNENGRTCTHARTESWKRLASHWYPSVVVFARVAVILQIFPLFLHCEKQSVKVDPILVVVYACLPEFATTIVLEKA